MAFRNKLFPRLSRHGNSTDGDMDIAEFDEKYSKYCDIKVNARKVQSQVENVLRKLKEFHDSVSELSQTMQDVYIGDPDAAEFVGSFTEATDDAQHGFVDHLSSTVHDAVVAPLRAYELELERIERRVQTFHRTKEGKNHYAKKVERLTERYERDSTISAAAASEEHVAKVEKTKNRLERSNSKLKNYSENFNASFGSTLKELDTVIENSKLQFDPTFSRFADFLTMMHLENAGHMFRVKRAVEELRGRCEELIDRRIFHSAESEAEDAAAAAAAGSSMALKPMQPEFYFDSFVAAKGMKHMQGFLQMKGRLMMRSVFVVLEGPLMKIYKVKDAEEHQIEWATATQQYTVKNSSEWDDYEDTGIQVGTKEDGVLHFLAPNEATADKWMRALISCIAFDGVKSQTALDKQIEKSVRFADHCSSFLAMLDGVPYQDGPARMSARMSGVVTPPDLRVPTPPFVLPNDSDEEEMPGAVADQYVSDTSSNASDMDTLEIGTMNLMLEDSQAALAATSPMGNAPSPHAFGFNDKRAFAPAEGPVPEPIRKEFDFLRGRHDLLSFDRAIQSEEVREMMDGDAMDLESCRRIWESVDSSDGECFTVEEFYAFVKGCDMKKKLHSYQKETNLKLAHEVFEL